MPGMCALKHIHLMLGVDLHDEVTIVGVPAPKIPHGVFGLLCAGPWGLKTGLPDKSVWTTKAVSLAQGTDMGFFIPHIPFGPFILAPLLSILSGSKSHFASHRTLTSRGPQAFACLKYVNLNLNCFGPTPSPIPPFGYVLAFYSTQEIGATWGDIIAGSLHMAVDYLIQRVVNRVSNGFGKWANAKLGGLLASRFSNMGVRLSLLGVKTVGEILQSKGGGKVWSLLLGYGFLEQIPSGVLSTLVLGTPIGFSPKKSGTGLLEDYVLDPAQSQVAEEIDQDIEAIQNLPQKINQFFDAKFIEQFP